MDIHVKWDPVKAAANWRKHGVSFEAAVQAFRDPFVLTEQDRVEGSEQRWQSLGMVDGCLLVLLAHTLWFEDEAGFECEVARIISARQANRRKGADMSNNLVRLKLDDLPPLTEEQKAELAALAARPDEEIDYSDIPPLDEKFWQNAVRGRFYRPTKSSTTLRIDSDVLAWLRAQGKGYQSRINAILRREMLAAGPIKPAKPSP